MKKILFVMLFFSSFAFSQTVTATKEWGYHYKRICDTTLVSTYFKTLTVGNGSDPVSATWNVFSTAGTTDTIKVAFDGDTTSYMIVTPDIVYRPFIWRAKKIHLKGNGSLTVHIEVEY